MADKLAGPVFAIGGRLLGYAIAGPVGGIIGGVVGGLAGGVVGSMLAKSNAAKPLIPDMQLASSSYGGFRPIIYGQARVPGMVVWESDIEVKQHSGGGKGFGGSSGGSATSFWQSAAFAFCEGPAQLLKIWTDGNLFYDNTSASPHELTDFRFAFRQYGGDETQLPDPLISTWVSQHVIPGDAVPTYRGTSYCVFQQADLSHFGGRMPNVTALLSTNTTPTTLLRLMNRLSQDVSTTTNVQAVSVDWVRNAIYQLSTDGTIRVFDISTGDCIAARKMDLHNSNDWRIWSIQDLHVTQGGDLYLMSGGYDLRFNEDGSLGGFLWRSDYYIVVVDPSTLEVKSTTKFAHRSVVAQDVLEIVAFPCAGQTMIAGKWQFSKPFVCSPDGGVTDYIELPFAFGFWAHPDIVVGKQDVLSTDLYWVDGPTADPNMYIHHVTVSLMTDPLSTGFGFFGTPWGVSDDDMTTLGASDWGVTLLFPEFDTPATVYDPSDDTLIMSAHGRTIKWSASQGIIWNVAGTAMTPGSKRDFDISAGIIGDTVSTYSVTDAYYGLISQSGTVDGISPSSGHAYDSHANAVVFHHGSDVYVAYLQRQIHSDVLISDIIVDLCARGGLDASQIDVSTVTDTVVGYVIMQNKAVSACLADLCQAFQIDMVESDYKLKFVPRGQTAVATIPQADLMRVDSGDQNRFWIEKRAQQQELPLQINVRHTDPALDFQPGASYSKRIALPVPTQFSKRTQNVDLPVIVTNVQARHIAEKWLYTMWAERDTYQAAVPAKYLWLDPTDNITVNLENGESYTVRTEQTDIGLDYSTQLNLASEDATVYADSTSPAADYSFVPQTISPGPLIELFQFNVPLLQDTDDLGATASRIYYAGGVGDSGVSLSAILYKSADGTDYPQYSVISTFANWGQSLTVLGDTVAAFATDYTNTIAVRMSPGSLLPTSCTYLDLMNGKNAALLGEELIQYQNVAENADGSVVLSVLCRGCRGTEWATGSHTTGEKFILLDNTGVVQGNRLPLAELNVSENYKLVSAGRFLDTTPFEVFAYRGYDMKPYAPILFARTVSGSDLVLSWVRRTRIGGLMQDGTDTIPLGEESEAYEVYLIADAAHLTAFDPTNALTYKRKFAPLSAPTVTYTAAMMVTDSFTPTTQTLYMIVYQLSAAIGRGFQGYQALPAS